MRYRMLAAMVCGAVLFGGCYQRAVITPRAEASPTKIAVTIVSDAWHLGQLEEKLEGRLRQMLLENNVGVPVLSEEKAELVLRVKIIQANFTAAVDWEWQLVVVESDTVVMSRAESSALGSESDEMADLIFAGLVTVDTSPYADSGAVAPPRAERTSTPSGAPTSGTEGDNAWAVIVGVSSYRNGLPEATGAQKDAEAFATYATRTLGVPEPNIKILLGERASRADMAGALLEWLPRNAVSPGGRVYVFFSGHGAPDVENGDAFLVPWDANPAYIKTGGIAVGDIQRRLGKLQGQRVYMFLDACFSGQGGRSVLPKGTRPLVPVKSLNAEGIVTFSAAGARETTGLHASSGHGLFTHHLLAALSGAADQNRDGDITLAELTDYTTEKVAHEARRQNREQRPTIAAPSSLGLDSVILVDDLKVP